MKVVVVMVEEKKERIFLGWRRIIEREREREVEEKKGGYGKRKRVVRHSMIRVTWVDEETTTV